MKPITKLFFGFMLMIFVMLAAACSKNLFSAEGKFVAEERRLDLKQGGPFPRDWKGKHLAIKYEYIRKQDDFQIMGDIIFKREKTINDFSCSVVFIDAEGTVLQVKGLVVAGGRQPTKIIPFKQDMKLPPGSQSMAFSYSGTSRGTGQSGSPNAFWFTPWS
jgi:hypothetical protein